jgi:hypothetical protein
MYMNHKHEMYMFLCEIYKVYTFDFHWHSKCDKIECLDLKIGTQRVHVTIAVWITTEIVFFNSIWRNTMAIPYKRSKREKCMEFRKSKEH